MTFAIFVCNDMEEAWIASICAQGEREMAQWERDEDLDHEEQLAREAVADGDLTAWPAYADTPYEVEDPEVVDDADVLGLPVGEHDEHFDDELSAAQLEAEHEDA